MLAANVTLLVHSFGKPINYTCISKQPADTPHLINSYQLLLLILETKTEAINACLTSNNKEGEKRKTRIKEENESLAQAAGMSQRLGGIKRV